MSSQAPNIKSLNQLFKDTYGPAIEEMLGRKKSRPPCNAEKFILGIDEEEEVSQEETIKFVP